MDLGKRMDEAIKHAKETAGLSKRAVLRELTSAEVGCTHPTIQSYIRGNTEPGPTFLLEFSRICGVRWEWLVAEEGSMTQEEESEQERSFPTETRALLSKHFPFQNRLGTGEVEMVYEAILGYCGWMGSKVQGRLISRDDKVRGAERIARAINGPLEELQMEDVPPERMTIYISLLSTAILALFPPKVRRYKSLVKGPTEGLLRLLEERED